MAERNAVKERMCWNCGETLKVTASQLKSHATQCIGRKEEAR